MRGKNLAWPVFTTIEEAGNQDREQWFRNGTLKRLIENLIYAAQEQAIRINLPKGKIEKSKEETKRRMYSRNDKTINQIVSECPKLAQKEYKRRHVWIGQHTH